MRARYGNRPQPAITRPADPAVAGVAKVQALVDTARRNGPLFGSNQCLRPGHATRAAYIGRMDPLVSVVIPTHDRAYCLRDAVDSALEQTHGHLEVLIVDDGSRDETRELVAAAYGGEPRVRYLYQQNAGVSAARNRAHRAAAGELIAYLDSDDRWQPWKLELQLACLARLPEVGLLFTDIDLVDERGQLRRRTALRSFYDSHRRLELGRPFSTHLRLDEVAPRLAEHVAGGSLRAGAGFTQMVVGNLVLTSSAIIRRELTARESFDERMHHGEDYDFFLRVSRHRPIAFVDVATTLYRRGGTDQLSDERAAIAENYLRSVMPLLASDRTRIALPTDTLNELIGAAHRAAGHAAVAGGDRRGALEHLWLGLAGRRPGFEDLHLMLRALLPRPAYRALRALALRSPGRRSRGSVGSGGTSLPRVPIS
jgi:glycosyltransferase involved in cell wall biosynthesis